MHKRFTKYKVFRKKTGISSFCCASSRESGHFLLSSVLPKGFTMTVAQWMTTYIFFKNYLTQKAAYFASRKEFRNLVYQLSWFSEATLVLTLNWNLRTSSQQVGARIKNLSFSTFLRWNIDFKLNSVDNSSFCSSLCHWHIMELQNFTEGRSRNKRAWRFDWSRSFFR